MSKNTFYVSAPVDTYSGYGARSRDFVKALIELDEYDVKILPQRWGSTPQNFIQDHEEEWGFLRKHLITPQLSEQPDIWCQITVPNEFQPIGKYNIGLTAGIETTACIPQWLEGCNKMDLILTSSEHSKRVFKSTQFNVKDKNKQKKILKLTTPIEVLMEGANLDVYKPIKSDFNLDEIEDKWCYLFVGHWMQGNLGEDRKNVGLLVKSFYEIFKNKNKKPALILKTSGAGSSYMDRNEIQRKIDTIRKSIPSKDLPNVYILHGELSDEDMNSLYNHPKIKAMVSLTKGEGFGRPLLEFSLVNKPIIASAWSGHIDFLKPEFTGLLAGTLKNVHQSAANDFIIKEAQWFNADPNNIGYFLTDVFENIKTWNVKAKRQGYFSRTNFSFENMKSKMKELFEGNIPKIAKKEKLKLPENLTKIELPKKEKSNG